ncbi:aspartoacylase [Synechococcus sp. CCY9201]|uniref:aspartoacylase n=1 Tax=unclassified Synechococcus TaxID=2626047 RepID=UPI002AD1D6B9|nr:MULTISPECIES: aspartoacylase [unclassified Synechococcus]MEA5424245.1 aspartoacylase [Synechococcus sp. CCY9202]MEA5473794.1 aspartoacylase [Synechococcus sp. CCY9201]CAK6690858.1 aspartoacylase [Synechococcus sp. CBW1107]
MSGGDRAQVLVVAGTHGNERNAPWLLDAWRRQPALLDRSGLALELVLGNPEAHASNCRYRDRDLNRCFVPDLLDDPAEDAYEMQRARELIRRHGPEGTQPCLVALDLHSTTAAMGNSLVVYGRRPPDLALAAALQGTLGLPVYLHEADPHQSGFLVERWPCGLVVEVGPVPQGVVVPAICVQTQLAVEASLAALAAAGRGQLRLPRQLVVHRHLLILDLPRHAHGAVAACFDPRRMHRDWQPMWPGDPLFLGEEGQPLPYVPPPGLESEPVWPVFLNEAAYGEKGIALSLTRRESWPVDSAWSEALGAVASLLALEQG